ncbi:hypothetical protein D9758_009052 [Tetrapyrgos nigripes]|uniref:PHD-type domain-containing protein n=1 Tax=Tetrapyrgos nigripes TaxID=182062 RepID=A0A8H5G9X6_9AGAR|nr:hypothetical protein D9758_009052 [Tetrapyrgos nigripes]
MDLGSLVNSSPLGNGTKEEEWGRVLICGGTDWMRLGRKDRSGAPKAESDLSPDLLEPHILRSLADIRVRSIHTSCSSCHFVVIDTNSSPSGGGSNSAWLFGRNGNCCLGVEGVDCISENAPMRLKPTDLGAKPGTRFVDAACGRNHTLLVGSDGHVWSAGANAYGQCGHYPCPEIPNFKLVQGLQHDGVPERAVKVSAGVTFSLVLTESGKIFAFGSAEKGQLGNGSTGERITTGNKTAFDIVYEPRYIKELDGKKIKMIASGQQHSVALDEEGCTWCLVKVNNRVLRAEVVVVCVLSKESESWKAWRRRRSMLCVLVVHVWGYNGYCRLGLGNQVDALKPKPVPQFTPPTSCATFVAAGPTNTVVIDRQGMYWMAGKWKNSGDGSSGSPYTTFRVMQDIMWVFVLCSLRHHFVAFSSASASSCRFVASSADAFLPSFRSRGCKITHAACGGVTHWATTPDDDGTTMTVAWGQNAANVSRRLWITLDSGWITCCFPSCFTYNSLGLPAFFYTRITYYIFALGELGLGPEEPKSSTKPNKHEPLDQIEVTQIAAAQNTTLFLVKIPLAPYTPGVSISDPSEFDQKKMEKYQDLPRHPFELDDTPELCMVCRKDNGEDDSPLECDKCDNPYHLGCLKPKVPAIPPGEWFCPDCSKQPGRALPGYTPTVPPTAGGSSSSSKPTHASSATPQPRKRKGEDMDVDRPENGVDGEDESERVGVEKEFFFEKTLVELNTAWDVFQESCLGDDIVLSSLGFSLGHGMSKWGVNECLRCRTSLLLLHQNMAV